ncbi:MAG: hypothetical protein ACI9N1_003153 [Flavobacteriales bacterium]|jgi:hypothetical protein
MKVFWSYAKKDDQKPHNLTKLREAFNIALDQTLGVDSKLIVDVTDLKWGDKWNRKLEKSIKGADYFLPILSPSYFRSKMCMREFYWAIESNSKIIPILYRKCPSGLFSSFSDSDEENIRLNSCSKQISEYQYHDFNSLRNKPRDHEHILEFLDKIAEQLG